MREIDIGIEPNAKFETQVAAEQLFDGDSDLLLCRDIKNPNASIHLPN